MIKNKSLLVEIYVEEFPVRYLLSVNKQLPEIIKNVLMEYKIVYGEIEVSVSPIRLVIYVNNLEEKTSKEIIETIGPNTNIGIKNNEFTGAAIGFAKKYSIDLKNLYIKETNKGKFLAFKKIFGGENVKDILAEVVKNIISKLSFDKTMVWNEKRFKFPRPIRNILIFYGDENIKATIAGVKTTDTTFGLKTLPVKKIKIKGNSSKSATERYFELLENECVIVNHEKRLVVLKNMLENICSNKDLKYDNDNRLLEEINLLVEYPTCVLCDFDKIFLKLPKEVISTCMKTKQKFIPLYNSNNDLINSFIGVKNGSSEHLINVKKGYEKVLVARLNDAKFFYETDLKTDFVKRVELLKDIIYNAKIGSLYDKVLRIKFLAQYFNKKIGYNFEENILSQTASIIKNDVTTLMVQEYPELQGIMGKFYCLEQNISDEIAVVCQEHYLPKSFDDILPKNNISILFAISSKFSDILDNVIINNLPSGTSDPFGLKKVADGLIKIMVEKRIDVSLKDIFEKYCDFCSKKYDDNILDLLKNFLRQRVENIYTSNGYKIDEIRAVMFNFDGEFSSKIFCLETVNRYRNNIEFNKLIDIYKRVKNILMQGKQKYNFEQIVQEIDKNLLKLSQENFLVSKISDSYVKIKQFYKEKKFKELIDEIIRLKPAIDNFFEKVLVFDKEDAVAINRLRIVNKVLIIFDYIGKLELIQQ